MFTGKMPDVTPAQLLAVIASAATEAVAVGVITDRTDKLILATAGIVVPGIWKLADAIIRHGRSRHLAPAPAPAPAAPTTLVPTLPPVPPTSPTQS